MAFNKLTLHIQNVCVDLLELFCWEIKVLRTHFQRMINRGQLPSFVVVVFFFVVVCFCF